MLSMLPAADQGVAVLGAHCDDIAIGAGATLLGLCAAVPGLKIYALILTGAGTPRETEERAALAAFCPGAQLHVTVGALPDGRLPAHWSLAKAAVRALRRRCDPDLVLAPAPHDAHQDHRTLAELVPTEFRTHTTLGYEILKWESDLYQPTVLIPVEQTAARKVELLHQHYPSQHERTWFDAESFLGLMRIRGVQSGVRYAEGFHCTKLAIGGVRT